ncbi:hypothetical protein [Mesorhizobium huakuii]|uniref:hypothetical protein n=1 Tax=Mesorhizobium huakuii TaxID=28104 RepID=UPI0039088CDC
MAIATDNVDTDQLHRPRRWDIGFVRRFMLSFGPMSSLFDFATFAFLLFIAHAAPVTFQTSWHVESLMTQLARSYLSCARTMRAGRAVQARRLYGLRWVWRSSRSPCLCPLCGMVWVCAAAGDANEIAITDRRASLKTIFLLAVFVHLTVSARDLINSSSNSSWICVDRNQSARILHTTAARF